MLAAAALLTGCGGEKPSWPQGLVLRVVAPDGVLRELGEPCAGGQPFLYAHATAEFTLADASGKILEEDVLPEGEATALLNHDPGVDRVPTNCTFRVRVDVEASGRYTLRLGDSAPQEFGFKDGQAMVTLN
ncbi:hypothetical protein OJ997_11940 [Solirubrobacter phytolaccae]|uniref:Uncharacterized protein n=1 Tax=Solirubrobacter phytolaccae TaxID=1404360 RepID=A0A9X3S7G1_9ACTN|nr:hypothetical protein [Solirubrobacter phytolaccae]MDA0181009.1 hypothetical protein [Solirubrobacter phytolaccae]